MARIFRRSDRLAPVAGSALAAALIAAVLVATGSPARAASTATINGASTFQTMDGFGFSEAFQRSNLMHGSEGLSAANQKRVLDLLFDRSTGAGFSILRNGIGSSPNNSSDWMRAIAPTNPGSPNATPTWVWDGSDNSQVWLSQQAMSYGVKTIYADAWSAPGYMKTNGSDSNGGLLCGVPSAGCSTGDWRQAYANMLAKYVDLYAQAGIPITHVGFLNEPDYTPSYASMNSDGAQAADFIKVLDRTLPSGVKIVCCEPTGWGQANTMLSAIGSDPTAFAALDVASGHGYSGAPTYPLSRAKPAWQTEWSTFNGWDGSWDGGQDSSGFSWAGKVMTGITSANLSAFLYWWGASQDSDNQGLIGLNGDSVKVSGRLWAMANFSRFVRPGAVRIGANSSDSNVRLAAFTNSDGSVAVVALNGANSTSSVSFALNGTGITNGTAVPYLTNSGSNTAAQASIAVNGGSFTAGIPARSMVTYRITGTGITPTTTTPAPPTTTTTAPPTTTTAPPTTTTAPPTTTTPPTTTPAPPTTTTVPAACRVTDVVSAWNTGFTSNITVTNTGTAPIDGWSLGFTLPDGQTITNGWNATYTPSAGRVTAKNVSYNAAIAPNTSVTFGFQATHTGNTATPTDFTLNGAACT
jgi:glucuronoarabinoxylan endo-1,4-beta-xylanase